MNYADAERLKTVLADLDYQETKKETKADLIMVIACSVRQSAIDRIWGKLNRWQKLKPRPTLALTGCILPADQKKFADQFDLIFNINKLAHLPALLSSRKKVEKLISDYLETQPQYQSTFQAYLPISNGCNNFCSYCVVPYTRGREKSRSINKIISEVKALVKRGCKEITLLGQNVNSYDQDLTNLESGIGNRESNNFIKLLKEIDNIPGDFWLRFLTNHPKDMTSELIRTLAEMRHFPHYIHLPVQSGDNQILRKMKRNYTIKKYLDLIKKTRQLMPDCAISTDVIVGFPGETKEQFNNTVKLFKKVQFDMAYIAQYSSRPGTYAAEHFKDNITKKKKQRRQNVLNEILKKTALAKNEKLINKEIKVLVEQKFGFKMYRGKTEGFKNVEFQSEKNMVGKSVRLRITSVQPFGLRGKLL